jgi:hypothetical protein
VPGVDRLAGGLLKFLRAPFLDAAEPKTLEAAECDVVDAAAKLGARAIPKEPAKASGTRILRCCTASLPRERSCATEAQDKRIKHPNVSPMSVAHHDLASQFLYSQRTYRRRWGA